MMNITVCILSFNRASYLCEALQSILNQTQKPVDIIIFDNGSRGEVYDAVKKYLENGVGWVGADFTHSATWNFKRAVASARSDYVLVMHDDDKLCPDFIQKQLDFLKSNPEVGAVTCNGYLINESGNRNGRLLRSDSITSKPEFYRCSADIAITYASDSCIPFSPIVYKTKLVKEIDFQEDFGKVCDAVFLCDFADRDVIAYQAMALYECRVHDGQDSSFFPAELMKKLETFFWTRKSHNQEDIAYLHNLLVRQHTAWIMRQIFDACKGLKSPSFIFSVLSKVKEERFSTLAALRICCHALVKRGFRMRAKPY